MFLVVGKSFISYFELSIKSLLRSKLVFFKVFGKYLNNSYFYNNFNIGLYFYYI